MTRSPWCVVRARVGVGLVDGGAGLLALEEQRVGPGPPGEEDQVHHHADAAHTDHLTDDVDRCEAVEQGPAVLLERLAVGAEEVLDDVALLGVVDGDPQRRLRGDAGSSRAPSS